MTLEEMCARVSERLGEGQSGPGSYATSEIIAALNEADRFFVFLTLGLEVTAPWTVPVAANFFHMLTYFPDWIVPLRLADAEGRRVRPARLEDLTSLDRAWLGTSGNPQRYSALGADFLVLYPHLVAEVILTVTYCRAPVPLTTMSQEPETPGEYHTVYVDYAIYRMRQVEGGQEFQKGLKYFDSFLDAAGRYGAYVRGRNLGSRYDKVPFELELFDKSKMLNLRPDLPPRRPVAAEA